VFAPTSDDADENRRGGDGVIAGEIVARAAFAPRDSGRCISRR
jgi:hypothetical protein